MRTAPLLLLCLLGCTSTPKPDKTVALAGQSAEAGTRSWLKAHQDHREAFRLVAESLRGETNEVKFAKLISSLPASSLCGDSSAVYLSQPHLVVHDGKHATVADAAARKATLAGLKRGMAPLPPMPEKVKRVYRLLPHAISEVDSLGRSNLSGLYTLELNHGQPTNGLPPASDAEFAAYLLTKTNGVGIYRVEKREAGETNWTQINGFTSGPGEFRVRRVK